MRTTNILAVTLALAAMAIPGAALERQRPWWPQPYKVNRAAASLTLSTPYFTIEHDLKKGGAISRISLTHGKAQNLLAAPLATGVRLQTGDVSPSDAPRSHAQSFKNYSDLRDGAPAVNHRSTGGAEVISVEAKLLADDGEDSGFKVATTYSYRWGYIRIRKTISPPSSPARTKAITVLSTTVHPSLTDYGYRPAVSEEMGGNPHEWTNGQIRRWGKMRPGVSFDLPFRTRYVPRYVVLANHGVEGLEWFTGDNLAQWDYQLTGQPGTAAASISASADPPGIRLSIEALNLASSSAMPRGGYLELAKPCDFDYYIGFPVLPGHANKPWLHDSMRGVRNQQGKELTEDDIRAWAESDIREVTLHNDGDVFRDGVFWRDGSYPPYPPNVMRRMDELLALSRKHGIRVAPYFSNHELHQSTEEYKKHGEEWGRKPDDQGNLRPNYYYGSHMCLKSGWLDFHKFCVDRVLKNHNFDGVYYDWNIAMYCNNPLHVSKPEAAPCGKGLAALAQSPAGHWDIDELLELVEWTRKRVGKEGLFIVHNTLVPMFATENFADRVVGMEFGYARARAEMPKVAELPLEWSFAGARSRGVIVRGTVEDDAPERVFRLHALTGLMTQSMPWRANKHAIEFVKALKPLGDVERYRFEDWRNRAVTLDSGDAISAVYSREGEAYVLVANFSAESQQVLCALRASLLPYSLASITSAERIQDGKSAPVEASKLAGAGVRLTLPPENVVLLRVRQ
ncbi:MAG: hypothetical protein KIT09_21945 [Bryobacteraceae bacterium]|nr:hypothetical protein [Bryobacteraceae bacterium]